MIQLLKKMNRWKKGELEAVLEDAAKASSDSIYSGVEWIKKSKLILKIFVFFYRISNLEFFIFQRPEKFSTMNPKLNNFNAKSMNLFN